jgi:hypothetical protein
VSFGDDDVRTPAPIRLAKDDFFGRFVDESSEPSYDYCVVDLSADLELAGRHNFELEKADDLIKVGDEVMFLGFISAEYRKANVHVIRIDGSVNRGNSGGPLIHFRSKKVVGLIPLTETGLERDFNALVPTPRQHIAGLSGSVARVLIGGADPLDATRVTMSKLERIAQNLKRPAQVGIGMAYCTEHVIDSGRL